VTVRWLDIAWADLVGRCHLTRVRHEGADEGVPIPVSVVAAGYDAPGHLPELTGAGIGADRVRLMPDTATERPNPFRPDSLLCVGSLCVGSPSVGSPSGDHREPSELCSRSALGRVIDRFSELGYRIQAAAELEFFLLDPATNQPLWADINQYSVTKGGELDFVFSRISRELQQLGIPVEAMAPEYSGGQVEVNIHHAPALEAADHTVLARYFIREIARSCGLGATFLAKPWTDQAGNGLHVHQSLWSGRTNVMHEQGALSDLARGYLAGQLVHMRELALLGCSNPNAYHRRADMSFAPTTICWGVDNRTVAVRAIVGSEGSTRIEQRDASADCNIYLAFAGQFGSGLDGVQRQIPLGPPVTCNAYERTGDEQLPVSFTDALAGFESSEFAHELLGATATRYEQVLKAERDQVILNSSDWERERYLQAI
jgi:glutamine synthetase